jgi:hypothetical protein
MSANEAEIVSEIGHGRSRRANSSLRCVYMLLLVCALSKEFFVPGANRARPLARPAKNK